MKKILTATLITSTLLSANAFAGDKRNGHFGKGEFSSAKIYRKLDLTDEQKKEMKAIFSAARNKNQAETRRSERKASIQQRRALIEATTFDVDAVKQLAEARAQKMTERFIKMAEAEHKVWHLLTPDQQAKAKEIIQKRAQRMEKHMEKRMKKYSEKNRHQQD